MTLGTGLRRGGPHAVAAAIAVIRPELVSTDLFDTVLLRDSSLETSRLAEACHRAAPQLGVDARALTALRWEMQDAAYRAVALERPDGDASLTAVCAAAVTALGLGPEQARILHDAELEVDIRRLRPHRALLAVLDRAAADGHRVVAVSDTYYSAHDLERILAVMVGAHPLARIHCSSDIGLTKHAGGLYAEVARREGVAPERILHMGDNHRVDVEQARAAGWAAVHLPRGRRYRLARTAGVLRGLPAVRRRIR